MTRIYNPPLILIFAFSAFLVIIINLFLSVRFEENDDVVMLLISSGKYSNHFNNHLVFINFIFGSVLNILYQLTTKIEWYTVSLVFLNTLSIALIVKSIFKLSYPFIFKIILIFLSFSIFIHLSLLLQFTKTASILAIAGLITISNTNYRFFGALVIIIGTLIRFEAAILITLIFLPLFWFQNKGFRAYLCDKKIKVLVFTILISCVFKIADYSYYQLDSDWKHYLEFNQLRGKINDNPNAMLNDLNLPEDVLLEDYRLLLRGTANPFAISYRKLEKIYMSIDKTTFWQKLKNCAFMFYNYRYYILSIIIIGFLFFKKNKNQRFQILLVLFLFLGLLSFISMNATVKPRVFFPSYFSAVLLLFYLNPKQKIEISNIVAFTIIFIVSINFIHKSYNAEGSNEILKNKFNKQSELIDKYLKANNTNKLVPFWASYRIEYSNPYYLSLNYPSQKIFYSGWLAHIPLNKGKLDSFNYFIEGYGLLVNKGYAEEAQNLVSSSISNSNNIKVIPNVILDKYNIMIIEFLKDNSIHSN